MATLPVGDDYGVRRIRDELHRTLRSYIEAQYHIRDESLIRERHHLLEEAGSIAQRPFVEATPVYKSGLPYAQLDIPQRVRDLLTELADLKNPAVGIFQSPYSHQATALEAFLTRGEDLVIATGTGSGKTESFLMPILGTLVLEAQRSPKTAKLPGMRALLLYPLNALVSDQLGRVRKLFGDARVASRLAEGRSRPVRFGMYTSRTPYPGPRTSIRDPEYLDPLFRGFYLRQDGTTWVENTELKGILAPRGRWPCKNLTGFFGQPGKRWEKRLLTQMGDTELFTRHEIQDQCPDLLITNYSMLEYMMLRPIERRLFEQTKEWLHKDKSGVFVLVLDEAHTYRGAGGAEVALLLRRLRARLEIPRDRFRCILTSASLGSPQEVEKFARDLTGESPRSRFYLVPSVTETRSGAQPGTASQAEILANFRLGDFQRYEVSESARQEATKAVSDLAEALKWPLPSIPQELPYYLFERLTGWGPAEDAIARISGRATAFSVLAETLFPGTQPERAEKATQTLLALLTFARLRQGVGRDDRILMPARLHLFFRGLPAQHVCTNRTCRFRRDQTPPQGLQFLLGKLHTRPSLRCECGSRTYELLTHRVCGCAFIRGYLEGPTGNFLFHEPSGLLGRDPTAPLCRVHLLVESPHPKSSENGEVVEAWLNPGTGRLETQRPPRSEGWLSVWLPAISTVDQGGLREFASCPVCRSRWPADRSQIMDLVTKGEAPFSNLVKAQVLTQPPRTERSAKAPNEGRKVLLFSDGRQKAARLARDIPREVEQDSFRQAIALAILALQERRIPTHPALDLYIAFVSIAEMYHLAYFEKQDQRQLLAHAATFRNDYEGSLENAFAERWPPSPIPGRYQEALLRQLASRYYSLSATTLGFVAPARIPLKNFTTVFSRLARGVSVQQSPVEADAVATAWIADLLRDDLAFGDVNGAMRCAVAGYPPKSWGSEGKLSMVLRQLLGDQGGVPPSDIREMEEELQKQFGLPPNDKRYRIDPAKVRLIIDLDRPWRQCQDCTFLSPVLIMGRCINCGSARVNQLDPTTSTYLRSRKGFWRESLQDCIAGRGRPSYVCAEEHTAQLSYRDQGTVYATTEEHELRFQDIVLPGHEHDGPIDVLSCTTTMEVGVDIGSLVAIGLRNVPPQRENYQQRAGRSGRRGSAVSTVVTYSQEGPHDSHYYAHPEQIVSGPPRKPAVHTDNPRIARRHVNAYLLQTFFHQLIGQGTPPPGGDSGRLDSALGLGREFLTGTDKGFTLVTFADWVDREVLASGGAQTKRIVDWLPPTVAQKPAVWVRDVASAFITDLRTLALEFARTKENEPDLLDFLFDHGSLPTYAFPTDLCSFNVEDASDPYHIRTVEKPQQALHLGLSEYAPGRLIVINKETYRSGGVAASMLPTEVDRAVPLFELRRFYVFCPNCSYVQMPRDESNISLEDAELCPLCREGTLLSSRMITPEVFYPDGGQAISPTDRDQEYTYATSAQFPVPIGNEDLGGSEPLGLNARLYRAFNQPLVIVNRGDDETDEGFWVCDHCGTSSVARDSDPPSAGHRRPYHIQRRRNQPSPGRCQGQFQRVFLGHRFLSDLMLIRLTFKQPFGQNTADAVLRCALEDALRTFSEGLLLATSRHLDIDAAELSAGFRLLPKAEKEDLRADVYLFDTLSGGAGYSEQAGREIEAVLTTLEQVLGHCPAGCDTSCQGCLRHYANRYFHTQLDRRLGLALLYYLRDGRTPLVDDLAAQSQRLEPLRDLLILDGYQAATNVRHEGHQVPLLVTRKGRHVATGCYVGLVSDQSEEFKHPLDSIRGKPKTDVCLINDYRLTRNLPAAYAQVRDLIGRF
jgi:Lhr-like helicase